MLQSNCGKLSRTSCTITLERSSSVEEGASMEVCKTSYVMRNDNEGREAPITDRTWFAYGYRRWQIKCNELVNVEDDKCIIIGYDEARLLATSEKKQNAVWKWQKDRYRETHPRANNCKRRLWTHRRKNAASFGTRRFEAVEIVQNAAVLNLPENP